MTEPGGSIEDARDFLAISEHLWTCGQPDATQLADAARRGRQVVINLGLHDNPPWSLEGEPQIVEELGMRYVHVPVVFESPQLEDLDNFFDAMATHAGQSLLVHCFANWRVTAFLGLHQELVLGMPAAEAFAPQRAVWTLDHTWQDFVERARKRDRAS